MTSAPTVSELLLAAFDAAIAAMGGNTSKECSSNPRKFPSGADTEGTNGANPSTRTAVSTVSAGGVRLRFTGTSSSPHLPSNSTHVELFMSKVISAFLEAKRECEEWATAKVAVRTHLRQARV